MDETLPERVSALAVALRRERSPEDAVGWKIRRPAHVIAVEGGTCLPHLELRRGDLAIYLRLGEPQAIVGSPFRHKTPLVLVSEDAEAVTLRFPEGQTVQCLPGTVLAALAEHFDTVDTAPAHRELRRAA